MPASFLDNMIHIPHATLALFIVLVVYFAIMAIKHAISGLRSLWANAVAFVKKRQQRQREEVAAENPPIVRRSDSVRYNAEGEIISIVDGNLMEQISIDSAPIEVEMRDMRREAADVLNRDVNPTFPRSSHEDEVPPPYTAME